jgi:DNA-binding GntR family transcriptional regulator
MMLRERNGLVASGSWMKGEKTALYEDLKRQILTLELVPDDDLDETILSERYGISRTPVREVFRQLAGEGYVDIRENKGARVIPMNYATLRDFFLVAPMIYAAVGRLATQNFKAAQLTQLKQSQKNFRDAMNRRNGERMVLENNRFHEIIGEMSNNVFLKPSLGRLLIDHARIGHTFFRPKDEEMNTRLKAACAHHDQFIDAIAERDETRVVELVFEHWDLSRHTMELFIAPKGLKADARVQDPQAASTVKLP